MDMRKVVDVIARIQKWVDQGIIFELLFNLNNDIKALDIYNTIYRAWEQGIKTIYYPRTIQRNSNLATAQEECVSCANYVRRESLMPNKNMQAKKLFNPQGNNSKDHRRIISGDTTNLFNLNNTRYTWATKIYRIIMEIFAKAIIANYLLVAFYFYNGFIFFYLLSSRNLTSGTADIIRYINRDELTHVVLFKNIITTIMEENPGFISEELVYSMFSQAVDQEIAWTNHIIGDDILGVTKKSTEDYAKYLANKRITRLGLKELYPDSTHNPCEHLEKLADTEGKGDIKANFFESTVTSYNQSSTVPGWDEL